MERLQKILAAAGVASRRKCEELIAAGRVKVNGEVVTAMGLKVEPTDILEVDGRPVGGHEPYVYYLLNKPAGYVTTVTDTHDRPKVVDLVPPVPRVYPVGRLDLDTEGLLLLTNDGDLTNSLLHPSAEIDKVYRAVVSGEVDNAALKQLSEGIRLEEGMTSPARVNLIKRGEGKTIMEVTIHEGRKRQVRRMLLAVGHRVIHLERKVFAFLTLTGIERGKFRLLSDQEIQDLKKISGKKRSFNK